MTTTLDITALPCPEGWTWERTVRIAVLCSPGAPDGRWSAAVSPDRGGWLALVAPGAPADLNYRYLSTLYPTPIAAARAALRALVDAGHPETDVLRAAAGEPPRGPTRDQIAELLRRLGTAGPDEPITLAYHPDADPARGQPADGWLVAIGATIHHGPEALDALVGLIGDSHD